METRVSSLPGSTRQSIFPCKMMDARVKPAHDNSRFHLIEKPS